MPSFAGLVKRATRLCEKVVFVMLNNIILQKGRFTVETKL